MTEKHYSPDELAAFAMEGRGVDHDAAAAHASDCATCGPEWKRAQPPAEVAAPSPMPGLLVAASVLVSVVIAFAMSTPAISPYRILLALCTIGVATLLPSLALRSEREAIGAMVGALALSVTLGWLDYTEFPLIGAHAMGCFETEIAIGALPLVAMVGLARSSGVRLGSLASAAAGASGALAGQGVLLTTCAADESVLHVLFYHCAGVVVAALVGGGLGALVARRAA